VAEVKHKVRPPGPLLKHRDGTSRRMGSSRLTNETAGQTDAREVGLTEELEAELTVTRICDSILGRLDEVEAHQTKWRRGKHAI
jgi:hypothetical protein